MFRKSILIGLSCLILGTGCSTASISSQGISTPHGATTKYKKEASKGEDMFISYLGMAILFAAIFLSAPKEAYK